MKLTSLMLTALSVLGLAAPNPTVLGQRAHEMSIADGVSHNEQMTVEADQYDRVSSIYDVPPLDADGNNATEWSIHPEHTGDNVKYIFHRDLEPRDDTDHYLEECNSDHPVNQKACVYNKIVPKGKGTGVCTARIQKAAWAGTMHILDRNIMCKYYRDANCKGPFSGPYSNQELDYSWNAAYYSQVLENPQSVFCQNIGFQPPNVPVKPPKPNPYPGPMWSPLLETVLAKTCLFSEIGPGGQCPGD